MELWDDLKICHCCLFALVTSTNETAGRVQRGGYDSRFKFGGGNCADLSEVVASEVVASLSRRFSSIFQCLLSQQLLQAELHKSGTNRRCCWQMVS